MKRLFLPLILLTVLLASCAPVEVSAPAPSIRVNADTSKWTSIPAGEFHHGQFNEMATINYDYEMMVYLVTNQQYAAFINAALAEGGIKIDGDKIAGFYSG
ncbi:MAG: hypothetical protein HZB19_07475, partial [Chloroflexi bacterium]|nr:hypothetical protein [Chloroflexota bacterium]